MHEPMPPSARRLGLASGAAVALLCLAYVVVLSVGLATLPSPDRPIQPPWLPVMELLILGIAPAMVTLTVALHAAAPNERKPLGLASVAFSAMCAALTCTVHFAILTLGDHAAFAHPPWTDLVFAFEWPSVVYALDILAWDVFFPLAALGAALTLRGDGRLKVARNLLLASAALSFLGLAGVPLADMRVRNVGILGYAVVYPIAAAVLAIHFHRAGSEKASAGSLPPRRPPANA